MPALAEIVENCWVLVSTVYAWLSTQGPQPYLIGQGEGPYLLDSVRAVKALDAEQAELDMVPETIVGGHSQGGQAVLWTGGLASTYAPGLPITWIAAIAPASDAIGLAESKPNIAGGSVFGSYVAAACADTYRVCPSPTASVPWP